jgi:hypothetical protein
VQVSGKKLVVFGALFGLATLALVIVSFKSIGWNRFVQNSRLVEGKSSSVWLARAVMACAEETGELPATSTAVPKTLADVGGKTYASTPADWSADATLRCAKFSMEKPQSFRYQWERTGDLAGTARAEGDFDGDGKAEAIYEQEVECSRVQDGKLRCRPGRFHDIAPKKAP